MPLIVNCKECGYILYSGGFYAMKYMSKSIPQQVCDIHGGWCPKCKRRLKMSNVKKEDVTILPNLEYFPRRKEDEP